MSTWHDHFKSDVIILYTVEVVCEIYWWYKNRRSIFSHEYLQLYHCFIFTIAVSVCSRSSWHHLLSNKRLYGSTCLWSKCTEHRCLIFSVAKQYTGKPFSVSCVMMTWGQFHLVQNLNFCNIFANLLCCTFFRQPIGLLVPVEKNQWDMGPD